MRSLIKKLFTRKREIKTDPDSIMNHVPNVRTVNHVKTWQHDATKYTSPLG